ncbi:MAG TPA: hypothetical protein ENK21_05695, partial [Trueperaceae bacterium]|nr:hypothetical protein [Trueperaceae bacterium]
MTYQKRTDNVLSNKAMLELRTVLLKLLGTARLESKKISNLQLLILSYLYLEGEQNRNNLATLFFAHLNRPRESLRVALAKLNQKIGKGSLVINNDIVSLAPACDCDITMFRQAIENQDYPTAEQLYEDYFFKGLEQDNRLELTDELQTWLFDLREEFAEQIRTALISLAKEAKTKSKQKKYAEKAFLIEKAPEFFFEELEELSKILSQSKSRFAHAAKTELNKLHAEGIFGHLKQKDKNILLAMALVERYGLSNSCLEKAFEQDSQMLISFRNKLTELLKPLAADEAMQAILTTAQEYLDDYPNERNHFALKLAKESTDSQQLFNLYEDIYRTRNDFGNAQELPEHIKHINLIYRKKSEEYLDAQEFLLAQNLLAKVRTSQESLGANVDQENLFLEAYALERQGQFSKALELIKNAQKTDKIEALKSVLLLHAKNLNEAEIKAKNILNNTDDVWAQALAYNTLGTVKANQGLFYEAIEQFSKAGNRWKLINQNQRFFGATMNQASSYSYSGDTSQALDMYDDLLDLTMENPHLQTTLMLNKSDALFRSHQYKDAEKVLLRLLKQLNTKAQPQDEIYSRVLANLAYTNIKLKNH